MYFLNSTYFIFNQFKTNNFYISFVVEYRMALAKLCLKIWDVLTKVCNETLFKVYENCEEYRISGNTTLYSLL